MATNADTLHHQGIALAQQGRLDEAAALLQQVLQYQPDHVDATIDLGNVYFMQGNVEAAIHRYQRGLELAPRHAIAHYNLGLALQQQGRTDETIACYRRALDLHPGHLDARNNLGNALKSQGKLADAIACYQEVLRLQPNFAEVHVNLGCALSDEGNLEGAVACFQQAVALKPNYAEGYANLGAALVQMGRPGQAVTQCQQALRIWPDCAEAHATLAHALRRLGRAGEAVAHNQYVIRLRPKSPEAYYNLGIAFQELGRLDEAVTHYLQAVRLNPNYAEAHLNLGTALLGLDQPEEAAASLREALRCRPRSAEAYCNLGNVLKSQGMFEEAALQYQQALEINPDFAAALNNLGTGYFQQGKPHEALALYQKALTLEPDLADAHRNRAAASLLIGDFEQGWPEYEWRWTQAGFVRPSFTQPLWDGSTLPDRTILIHAEQGLGDTLQFIRYAPLVKERVGRVIVQCQAPLVDLLAGAPGVDLLVPRGDPLPEFDVQAPLLNLPGIFRMTLANIPAPLTLAADQTRVQRWQEELKPLQGFKVGIAWQGNPSHIHDRQRSIPLARFGRLAEVEGVDLISLQKGPGTEQLLPIAGDFSVCDAGSLLENFQDTAALMKCLDLVIACDTVVIHLAAALGIPAWVALPLVPDWRWLLEREDSPWYPTVRLFRQAQYGNWLEVFERMAEELRARREGA